MRKLDKAGYPVKAVTRLTGLTADTLRAWERRYGAIAPTRRDSGHRVYSAADVARLRRLRAAVEAGHAIGAVANLDDDALDALGAPAPAAAAPPDDVVGRVLAAIGRYDPVEADAVLARAAVLLPAGRLVHEVAAPLLQAVGDRWAEGRLGVAQEHMVTGLLRSTLGALLRVMGPGARRAPLLLATPPGERHELGLLLVALLAAARGIPVCYLGADVPLGELAEAARRVRPAAVGLSLVRVEDPRAAGRAVEAVIAAVAPVPVWLGGAGAALVPAAAGGRRFADLAAVEAALDAM